jgi:hypothetical protein
MHLESIFNSNIFILILQLRPTVVIQNHAETGISLLYNRTVFLALVMI